MGSEIFSDQFRQNYPFKLSLSGVKLSQRTWPYAEQGMLTRFHLPAALKAGKIKKAEGLVLCSVNIVVTVLCSASPCHASFIWRQVVLKRLDCSLCLRSVWRSYLVLGVLVPRKTLHCWVNWNEREAPLCCGKRGEDASPLPRICVWGKVLLPLKKVPEYRALSLYGGFKS